MGSCFSRPPKPTDDDIPLSTGDPWDRSDRAREEADAVPKYYRDKQVREGIERRRMARMEREAAGLKAEGKELKESSLGKSHEESGEGSRDGGNDKGEMSVEENAVI